MIYLTSSRQWLEILEISEWYTQDGAALLRRSLGALDFIAYIALLTPIKVYKKLKLQKKKILLIR